METKRIVACQFRKKYFKLPNSFLNLLRYRMLVHAILMHIFSILIYLLIFPQQHFQLQRTDNKQTHGSTSNCSFNIHADKTKSFRKQKNGNDP